MVEVLVFNNPYDLDAIPLEDMGGWCLFGRYSDNSKGFEAVDKLYDLGVEDEDIEVSIY